MSDIRPSTRSLTGTIDASVTSVTDLIADNISSGTIYSGTSRANAEATYRTDMNIITKMKLMLVVLFIQWAALTFLVVRHIYYVPCSYTGGGF